MKKELKINEYDDDDLSTSITKMGCKEFGAPLIKISFFGPLCSPWKIINFDAHIRTVFQAHCASRPSNF